MYLKPSGKSVIIETRDGEMKEVQNDNFYNPKRILTKWEDRLDFYHGANNFLYIRGNPHIFDIEILDAVLKNNIIDTKNVAYDFDISQNFTWNHKELVEIKKRKRRYTRIYKPTAKVLINQVSKFNWNRMKLAGKTQDHRKPVNNYVLFKFNPDEYIPN